MADEAATLKQVHKALMGFTKRAEKSNDEMLVATFVDSEPLADLLSTNNNQVLYGRRGTGKTHALKFVAEQVEELGDKAIYVDLRTVGSSGSIYGDPHRPMAERASSLVIDVLNAVFSELEGIAIDQVDYHPHPDQLTAMVDQLRHSLSTFRVVGRIESSEEDRSNRSASARASVSASNSGAALTGELGRTSTNERVKRTIRSGEEVLHLDFGSIASALRGLIDRLNVNRIWLLLDEWSEVPYDLQPYLADLIRRTVITVPTVTIKIAAIEHRSVFSVPLPRGEYIGLELGADIFADLNLDNFLVFDNDQDKATTFFKTLIFRHYENAAGYDPQIDSADKLISTLFTQWPAFEEFVRAVEGVPRDALNLASAVATKAFGQKIAVSHVRTAARDWYEQDKAATIRSSEALTKLLTFIVDEVLAQRRARAFLYQSNSRMELIEKLFDARLLHILKRNISSHDQPGARFDVYKIDYGCYVDLINTSRAPTSLFTVDDGDEVVEVPKDDYRSIRRAILRDADFITALSDGSGTGEGGGLAMANVKFFLSSADAAIDSAVSDEVAEVVNRVTKDDERR